MKNMILWILIGVCALAFVAGCSPSQPAQPKADGGYDLVFEEVDGFAAIEAEHYFQQTKDEIRKWYLFRKDAWPKPGPDHDEPHCEGASNNAYLELLPDTRVTHGDKLIGGKNFSGEPGSIGFLHYKVHFNTPGRYYVWVRAFSTGSEDNGIHVGLNGEWPESGKRMQWCEGKKTWRWESKQRTKKNHCGEPYKIYLDIESAGVHEIIFSMREDGFEFDKFILTTEKEFRPEGVNQPVFVKSGALPEAFPVVERDLATKKTMISAIRHDLAGIKIMDAKSFNLEGSAFQVEQPYLAIDPTQAQEASATITFKPFRWMKVDAWDVVLLGVGEKAGTSEFEFSVNDIVVGACQVPVSEMETEEGSEFCKVWNEVVLKDGDVLKVIGRVGTNGESSSRARWGGIVVVPAGGASDLVLEAVDKNAELDGEVPTL